MLTIFGLGVFGFLFFGMLWRTACRWRYLADRYAGQGKGPSLEEKNLRGAVLIGLGGYESLHGILKMSVHATGVSLRLLAPFSLFHTPLFIPFQDIKGWSTTWYLDAKSIELQFAKAPEVKMIVSADLAEWIAGFSRQQMVVRDISPPGGPAGRGWRAVVLANFGFSVVMLGFVLGLVIMAL